MSYNKVGSKALARNVNILFGTTLNRVNLENQATVGAGYIYVYNVLEYFVTLNSNFTQYPTVSSAMII